MKLTRITLASLLIALLGCNSAHVEPKQLAEQSPRSDAPAASAPSTQPLVLEDEMRADLYFLASDRLEGRGVGTEGLDIAADYIATRFASLGLKPLPGVDGYFMPFDITTAEGIDPATTLSIGEKTLKVKEEYTPLAFSAEKEFSGSVVFVGYGITDASNKYDDYAGIDVKGKVVLAYRFEPHNKEGKSRWGKDDFTPNAHLENKAKAAAEHGAAGLILVNPPIHPGMPNDPLLPFAKQFSGTVAVPVVHMKQTTADELLKRGGLPTLKELQQKIDPDAKPASAELKDVTVKGKVAIKRTKKVVKNVVGYLPGSGPTADEYVIVGSHYDHLGLGGPGSLMNVPFGVHPTTTATTRPATTPSTTQTSATTKPATRVATTRAIHHGADDNGSGTTTMLELARIFSRRQSTQAPARSLIFCAFTAEESGLIGSNRFVSKPPIDLKKVALMLNLDMVGRVKKNLLYVGGGGTAAPLKEILKQADADSPLEFKNFGDGGMGPSDHMSFAVKKVPVIFLFSGNHEDYHRPTDTADKINYAGMAEVARMAAGLVDQFTRMPLSKYVDAADKSSMMNPMTAGTGGGGEGTRRASLGIIPVYGDEEDGKGVKIGGASAGTAAEKAGLQAGDIILELGGKPTTTLMELSAVLAARKPGDKLKLVYKRGEKTMSAEVTLGARPG